MERKEFSMEVGEMKSEKKKKEQTQRMEGLLALFLSLCLMFVLGLTSFQIGMYGDRKYRFYQKEYQKYQVAEEIGIQEKDLQKVTTHMMDFLIGKAERLSIQVKIDGERKDFFNHQDRIHMEDVKQLFRKGFFVRDFFLVVWILGAGYFLRKGKTGLHLLAQGFLKGIWAMGGILIVLGLGVWMNFSRAFVVFHKIFFSNNLWMFDPETDYMIRMLPEGFFFDMVKRIGGIYGVSLLFFLVLAVLIQGITKGRKDAIERKTRKANKSN